VAFFEIAERAPRHADAWANAGTAAWAANDTVGAVIGWQRAVRLEPLAGDVRERVGLLPANARDGLAHVPRVPSELPVLLAVALWCVAWGMLALGATRDRRALWKTGAAVMLMAIAATTWHVMLSSTRSAADLAVAEQRSPMRVSPGEDANANGDVDPGDMVVIGESRVNATRGDRWFAVQHVDGRLGWLPERVLYVFASSGGR